jgi:hypothetical protein
MTRVLVIIAVTGFLVSIICLTAAVGVVGPDAIARGALSWRPGFGWNFGRDYDGWRIHYHHNEDDEDGGPPTTRLIAWPGGDSIDVDLPANVKYTQAVGPAKLEVTGPRKAVADVKVDGGHIRFDHDRDDEANLTIVMSAPSVTRFAMSGSGKLAIADYSQDRLTVDLSGDSEVSAAGHAKAIELSISGSAHADLGRVMAKSAKVDIKGSGDAIVAPTDAAKIDISGSGDVTLLTDPAKLESNVSGSGGVQRGEPRSAAPHRSRSGRPRPS